MTPGRTGAALGVLGKINRHFPTAELKRLLHMHRRAGRGMHLMAGAAGPPLLALVHMKEMEVPRAIPEIRLFGCAHVRERRLVMAAEAQSIFAFGKSSVEVRWVILYQDPPVIRSMGVVAGNAVPAFRRAMPVLVRREERFHVNDRTLPGRQLLVVAPEAKVYLHRGKKPPLIGEMGVVAVHAGLRIVHRAMLGDRLFGKG